MDFANKFVGLWQSWTAVKGKRLNGGTIINTISQKNLRDCLRDCLRTHLPTDADECRSVIKSTTGNGCQLVNKRSLDEGVDIEDSSEYQYFDRPSWYLGMCRNSLFVKSD